MSLTSAPEAVPPDSGERPAVHPVDEVLPAPRLFVLGLQHLFIMYAGAVAVPLIVGGALKLPISTIGLLVNADLFVSGIATIIQSVGIGKIFGVRLPVVAGATITVLSPMIIIAQQYGLPAVYGAMLCSGVFGLLIAKPFSMMIRFFPPLVAGTVICVIGLSLIGADVSLIAGDNPAAKDYGQVSHIALAGLVMLLIVVITRCFRGFVSQIAVLLSIAIGTLVAWPMGLLDFSSTHSANWVGFSGFFRFGHPKFEAAAIISMCIVMLVTYTESTADMLAVSEMVDKKLTQNDLARGLATDALSAVLAGFLNSFPDTACGIMLLLLGLLPKIGQVVASVPGPVIGGAATVMFAMVTAVGIQTLHKVNFQGNNNLLIVAVSLAAGLLPAVAPTFYEHFPSNFQVIFGSSITSTVIVVFTLNLVFNHWSWRRQGTESAVEVAVREGAVAVDVPDDGVRGGEDTVNVPGPAASGEEKRF